MNALDINIYFKDKFGRLCILASAGGILPKYLLDDNNLAINEKKLLEINNLDNIAYKLPKKFKIARNPILSSILKFQYPDIETTEKHQEEIEYEEDYNFTRRYNLEFSKLSNDKISNKFEFNEFSDYFLTFDDLASRGFYVYDKLNINYAEDDNFILVSYPTYNKDNYKDKKNYKEALSYMNSIPELNTAIISKKNDIVYKDSFKNLKLIELLNSSLK